MTIDYDITVTAFLCVLVPRKTLTFNNKQTTKRATSRLQRSFIVQSESHQRQWKNDECVTCRYKFCHFASSKDKC